MNKNNNGFIMIITIFIVIIVSIIGFIGINTIIKNNLYINSKTDSFTLENKAENTINTILKYDGLVNTDGLGNDELNCSGGLIINNDLGVICSSKWIAGNDGIDDVCNNDDKTPYFFDKNINVSGILDSNSKIYDNDADARIQNIGFLFPFEEKTIFYFDENIKNNLVENSYNNYFSFPDLENSKIDMELIGGGTGVINITNIDISNKTKKYISSNIEFNKKGTLNENANFDLGTPYILNLKNKKHIISLKNNSKNIISYKIIIKDFLNNYLYQLPIKYLENSKSLKYYSLENNSQINSLEIYK